MKKTNPKKRTHGSTINEEVTYTFPLVTLRGIFNNHSSFFIPLRKLVSWPLLTVRNRVDEGLKNLLSRGILALISRIRRTMVENATYIYLRFFFFICKNKRTKNVQFRLSIVFQFRFFRWPSISHEIDQISKRAALVSKFSTLLAGTIVCEYMFHDVFHWIYACIA